MQAMLNGIGSYGIRWLQRHTAAPHDYPNAPQVRSRSAINAKVQREFGGGLTRGALTLRAVQNNTGYSRSQLLRARDALKQKWKRLQRGGDYIITEEQVDEILVWLTHDYWDKSARLYCCLGCQTEKRPPFGRGLCSRCYHRYRRRCIHLGLPTSPKAQRAALRVLDIDKIGPHATVLETVEARLAAGHALTDEDLDWMHMLSPSG